ncbi:MAG: hypothetical protein ACH0QD_04475 [Tepidibacillus sp.]
MKKVIIILSLFLLLPTFTPLYAADNNGQIDSSKKQITLPEKSVRENIEAVDLDKLANKVEGIGNKGYSLLQSGSIPYLVWGLAVGVILLLLGIFIKALRKIAFMTLSVALFGYILINYAPEIVERANFYFNKLLSMI